MDNMSTTLIHKYHTLKTKKSTKRLASQDIFPSPSPSPTAPLPTIAPSYSSFINDLVSAFNSLSTPSSSSTTSPTLHTSFQGVDHEALVDCRQKKKVIKALQLANPAQVNEIISLLKAMPDPSKTVAGVDAGEVRDTPKKAHSRDSSQQSLLSFVQDKGLKKKGEDTVKKQKTSKEQKGKETRLEEDEKLGEDWDRVEKKWSWETQKSNDQLTGVVDPESCKTAAESILATAGSWLFSSPSVASSTPTPPHSPSPPAAEKQKTLKSKPSKISTSATTNDATNTKATGFASLWMTTSPTTTTTTTTTTKSKPPVDPSSKKTARGPARRTASTTSLSTGEQIAQAAATLLATAAISRPKQLPNANPKQIRHQSSMPNIKTATLKRILPTTKASTTTSDSTTTKANTKKTDSTALTTTPSYISTTLSSLTKQWLTFQSGPPSTNMMSAYTYWWGYEIYVPHKCMDNIERVSNTSQIFFGFLSSAVGAIPGLAALVPIARIISAWVGYQWAVIKTQDAGKGVVISATWVLPVALASRPWDHQCEHEDNSFPDVSSLSTSPIKTLKSKLRLIGS